MESNKLIAEFLGAKPISLGASVEYEMYGIIECIKDGANEKHFFIPDEMEFKKSWDWLMPVVYKILWLEGYEDESYEGIHNGLTNALLSQTYDAVVEFIKLYNKKQ